MKNILFVIALFGTIPGLGSELEELKGQALGGDIRAATQLTPHYRELSVNLQSAVILAKYAEKEKSEPRCKAMSSVVKKMTDETQNAWLLALNDGDLESELGIAYLDEENYDRAAALFESAMEKGNMTAAFNRALMWERGLGSSGENLDEAFKLYTNCAENGDLKARHQIILMAFCGYRLEKPINLKKSLMTNAQKGCVESQLFLNTLYLFGNAELDIVANPEQSMQGFLAVPNSGYAHQLVSYIEVLKIKKENLLSIAQAKKQEKYALLAKYQDLKNIRDDSQKQIENLTVETRKTTTQIEESRSRLEAIEKEKERIGNRLEQLKLAKDKLKQELEEIQSNTPIDAQSEPEPILKEEKPLQPKTDTKITAITKLTSVPPAPPRAFTKDTPGNFTDREIECLRDFAMGGKSLKKRKLDQILKILGANFTKSGYVVNKKLGGHRSHNSDTFG